MLELLFLLLPISATYGYFMGYRSAKKSKDDANNKFSRDYMAGVNYLLSNQPQKAVDLFLNLLQQPTPPQSPETPEPNIFEAELTLGNLFRSRGEVDKAIRIHQKIDRSEEYTFEQKLLTKQQLAKDYLSVGFLDRAEDLYILLVNEPDFAENALQQLAFIYQKTKEWDKAIEVAKKLSVLTPQADNIPLAHYYCEQALYFKNNLQPYTELLNQSLEVYPNCVRASILLADEQLANKNYPLALKYLTQVLNQNPAYISEILLPLQCIYQKLHQQDEYELFLTQACKITGNNKVLLALVDLLEQKKGIVVAQRKLYEQIKLQPSPLLFERFVQYQISQTNDEKSQQSLELIQETLKNYIKRAPVYNCTQCGYKSNKLYWFCPSCNQWETIKPINHLSL